MSPLLQGVNPASGPAPSLIRQRIFRPEPARSSVPAGRSVRSEAAGGCCLVVHRHLGLSRVAIAARAGRRLAAVSRHQPGAREASGFRGSWGPLPPPSSIRMLTLPLWPVGPGPDRATLLRPGTTRSLVAPQERSNQPLQRTGRPLRGRPSRVITMLTSRRAVVAGPTAELHPLERGLRPEEGFSGTFVRRSDGPSDRRRNLQILFRGAQWTSVVCRRVRALRVRVLIRSEPRVVGSGRFVPASSPRWGRRSAVGPGPSSARQRIFRPEAARLGVPARRSVLPELAGGWCLVGVRQPVSYRRLIASRAGRGWAAVSRHQPGARGAIGVRYGRRPFAPPGSVQGHMLPSQPGRLGSGRSTLFRRGSPRSLAAPQHAF